mgnify:CR=1 FL=1
MNSARWPRSIKRACERLASLCKPKKKVELNWINAEVFENGTVPSQKLKDYDGIIIGAGHHGMVLGSYLARAGLLAATVSSVGLFHSSVTGAKSLSGS